MDNYFICSNAEEVRLVLVTDEDEGICCSYVLHVVGELILKDDGVKVRRGFMNLKLRFLFCKIGPQEYNKIQ